MQTYKDNNGCLICYVIRPGATIKPRASISNKYISNYIDKILLNLLIVCLMVASNVGKKAVYFFHDLLH